MEIVRLNEMAHTGIIAVKGANEGKPVAKVP